MISGTRITQINNLSLNKDHKLEAICQHFFIEHSEIRLGVKGFGFYSHVT